MSLAIGTIHGGKATNIMADEVKLTGTLDPFLRESAKRDMRTCGREGDRIRSSYSHPRVFWA